MSDRPHLMRFGSWCLALAWAMVLACLPARQAWAGLSVYTSWSSLPPTTTANQRTIDFDTNTLATEQSAGKITYSKSEGAATCILFICNSGGSVSYSSSSSLTGFSGKVASLTSGTTPNATSVTINFTNPTAYVGLLWGVEFNAENSMAVNLTLADNSVVTLKNCSSTSSSQCIGKYVSSNWLANIYNFLLGWILGDSVTYYPIYMQYQPDNGVKIKSMQIVVSNCAGCGFLSGNTSQDLKVDYITYVDTSVVPHHLEVTTAAATTTVGSAPAFTIKACGDASCSLPYTSGVSGTLAISGVTASPSSVAFSIPAGTSSTSVSSTLSTAGTAAISLSSYTPTPSNTPKVFCGMGVAAASGNSCNLVVGAAAPHHLELTTTSSSTLTCQPVTYTIKACADASCSSLYTNGVTGTFNLSSSSQAFTIAANSSSTSVSAYATSIGTATASLSGLSVTPSGSPQVYCGVGGAAASSGGSCGITVAAAGLLMSTPNHVSETSATMSVSAVSSINSTNTCATLFASTTKSVTFKCAYNNPSSGTLPVRVNGSALNAANSAGAVCDGTGRSVSLTFNASGVATPTVQYADVGQMTVTGAYTGSGSDAGLSLTGSSSFIVTPASFDLSAVAAPIKAGANFTSTVTARNNAGTATPNFGKESTPATVALSFTKTQPTGASSVAGTFTLSSLGAFSSGAATATMNWSEVGYGTLSAALTGGAYLGVASTASGSRSLGAFIPDRFEATVTQGCGDFTFIGQPFVLTIKAVNKAGTTTQNYDGTASTTPNQAYAVNLSASGVGAGWALSPTSLAASSFSQGVASISTAAFSFSNTSTSREVAPATTSLTVAESGGNGVSNSTALTAANVPVRSGRLRIFNKFGSEKQALDIVVQSQYWADKAWVLNAKDNCTAIPLAAVSLSGYKTNQGVATTAWTTTASAKSPYEATVNGQPGMKLSGGQGVISLSAPNPAATGSVDVALNLGLTGSTTDASCLSTHATTTGAGLTWLRSRNGSCATTYDRDPSARATFGIYAPETTKTIYGRELY